jgi:hypothetical protein
LYTYTDTTYEIVVNPLGNDPLHSGTLPIIDVGGQQYRPYQERSLIFYVSLLQLLLLMIAKVLDRQIIDRHLRNFLKSLLSRTESEESLSAANILLYVNAFMSLGALAWIAMDYLAIEWLAPPFQIYLIATLTISGFLFGKRSFAAFLGNLFERRRLFINMLRITENGLVVLGFLLLPVQLLINYSEGRWYLLFIGAAAVISMLMYSLNMFRAVRLSFLSGGIRLFHLISYICASEIFTLILIYKWLWLWTQALR